MQNFLKLSVKTEIISWLVVVLSWLAAIYFYQHLPMVVPTHWDFSGQANGWSGRAFATFFIPGIISGMYLLFLLIPYLDPRRERFVEFAGAYAMFRAALLVFMLAIYVCTSLVGLGYNIPIGLVMPIAVGLLFGVMGYYLQQVKSNWTIGIRNPWTMSDEKIWQKTNRLAGQVFYVSGGLMIVTAVLPEDWRLWVFVLAIALIVIVPNLYSMLTYFKAKKK